MTNTQKARAAAIQEQLAAGGLTVRVSFTGRGYLRLAVPAETAKRFSCDALIQDEARKILNMKPYEMGSIYITHE